MDALSSLQYTPISRKFPIYYRTSSQNPTGRTISTEQDTIPSSGGDPVTISSQAQDASKKNTTDAPKTPGASSSSNTDDPTTKQTQSVQELAEIQQLKQRDTAVRAHEQAHLAVAGQYATGGASYSYEIGPDGVRYAVGGEVPIDISSEKSPEATILKMETVRRAALAPLNPSSADLQIAAQATAKELQAMQKMRIQENEKASSRDEAASPSEQGSQSTGSTSSVSTNSSSELSPGNNQQIMIKAYQNVLSLA